MGEQSFIEERKLLTKLYECQEMMEKLLDDGKNDKHYFIMEILIKRLEIHLQDNSENGDLL
tara:strand:+ start:111 stop:293 length:183 start_codon:yes stop_codon:yes gene_type:complete